MVLKTLMVEQFQMLLKLLFAVLYRILDFFGICSFDLNTEIARYFFEEHLKQDPKQKIFKRYLHWRAFRPQTGETGISVFNIGTLLTNQKIDLGNKYVGRMKGERIAGFAHQTIGFFNDSCAQANLACPTPQFWPMPHYRHINLNLDTIQEAQNQLRSQLLARTLKKTLLDHSTYETIYF